jgi:hypothetical protein
MPVLAGPSRPPVPEDRQMQPWPRPGTAPYRRPRVRVTSHPSYPEPSGSVGAGDPVAARQTPCARRYSPVPTAARPGSPASSVVPPGRSRHSGAGAVFRGEPLPIVSTAGDGRSSGHEEDHHCHRARSDRPGARRPSPRGRIGPRPVPRPRHQGRRGAAQGRGGGSQCRRSLHDHRPPGPAPGQVGPACHLAHVSAPDSLGCPPRGGGGLCGACFRARRSPTGTSAVGAPR